jgi:Cu(I)/Ag(I) efflux system membrane fusion protein
MLGVAQKIGWINSGSGNGEASTAESGSQESTNVSYICPMMCVPPTTNPGRCPVCAMELVPASVSPSSGPSSHIQIDPRSRRVAGIQTVTAKSQTLFREVRGVGEISYDESKLKTLSAYIDGRIEELYADYTGIEVKKGDALAILYSPDLYAAQVGFARTLDFAVNATSSNDRIADSNRRLLESSRERLVELGMTETQIKKIEKNKVANSRLELHAPMSGTVIEKMAVTGQYIKAGEPVYRLADLSTVWLVLELFSEDASRIEIGQTVTATTQSMNGLDCEGKVEFVDRTVDPKMRTVGVRVAIDNKHGHLKPGEFARATLKIPLLSKDGQPQETIVVPRNSLLSVGQTSLVYVEGKPGEFELRRVKTGPTVEGQIAILEGLTAGENVVAKSTFLLDAQMQLQGNPSLMDPDKAVADGETQLTEAELKEIRKAMEPLSAEDRKLAEAQVICPVTEVRLGSMGMGTPIKLEIEGRTVFICCEGCRDKWVNEPVKYFKILDDYAAGKRSKSKTSASSKSTMPQIELPKMDMPQMELPEMELPKMELPQMKLPGE